MWLSLFQEFGNEILSMSARDGILMMVDGHQLFTPTSHVNHLKKKKIGVASSSE
jgi:hypothetical protein